MEPDMKSLNDLYAAMKERREARQINRAIRDLDPRIARDIGYVADHAHRLGHRL
jgi:hypothetical protein